MRVVIRSANFEDAQRGPGSLRRAGRVVFASLRGPDVAAVQEFTTKRTRWVDDSLNSTGNLEALPPYSTPTGSYPRGRVVWGSTEKRRPDGRFTRMLWAQGAQPPLVVDTSWLAVGHADETFHVVGAPNARGWTLMIADPRLAVQLLRDAKASGAGGARMFIGKRRFDFATLSLRKETRTVNQILTNRALLARNAQAAGHIDRQLETLLRETGLRPDELVRVPVLFDNEPIDLSVVRGGPPTGERQFYAYSPGIPNGLSLTPTRFIAPDPHGPKVNGRDIFQRATEDALRTAGVDVRFIENWDWLHAGGGEVHCGTNAFRDISGSARWWAPAPPGATT
jgi:protein-arginine deiminase